MNKQTKQQKIKLEPYNINRLANLCGQFDEHLKLIAQRLNIIIQNRGNLFQIEGEPIAVHCGQAVIKALYKETDRNQPISQEQVHHLITQFTADTNFINNSPLKPSSQSFHSQPANAYTFMNTNVNPCAWQPYIKSAEIQTPKTLIKTKTNNQALFIHNISKYDVNFGIGPAGTGKTFLAVAAAIQALEQKQIDQLILVRPAVEAGEKLGFLPGDWVEKVNPYLHPLYDALYEMLGVDRVKRLMEKQIIEIMPLAYMRGRTLNRAFIILDEGQNTTKAQMKMFLTRLGFGSKAIITGDITQQDLPEKIPSGLVEAMNILHLTPGISFTLFSNKDVMRNPLVQSIIEAYQNHQEQKSTSQKSGHFNPNPHTQQPTTKIKQNHEKKSIQKNISTSSDHSNLEI